MFLGPPGWVVLCGVLLFFPGQEHLTVRVPQTEAAYRRERLLERSRLAAFVVGTATLVYGILQPGLFPALWLALGGACLVAGAALHVMVRRQAIGVGLDASRRWVTLSGVHPDFVRAVEQQESSVHRS